MMTDCDEEEDLSRSQSPMIPLTIENTMIDIKTEPSDEDSKDFADHLTDFNEEEEEEEEDLLNSSLTPMDWLPKLNANAGVVEETVPEEEKKPPYSYASLIRLAILNSPSQKATLSDIYKWIEDQFLYYKNQKTAGWKNSIRHNLSLSKCFVKVPRPRHDPGKGYYWAINQLYSQDKAPFEKRKKGLLIGDMISGINLVQAAVQKKQLEYFLSAQMVQAAQAVQPAAGLEVGGGGGASIASYPEESLQLQQYHHLHHLHHLHPPSELKTERSSAMLLDDWATTSEADLSQFTAEKDSLSEYIKTKEDSAVLESGLLQPWSDIKTSDFLRSDVKTELPPLTPEDPSFFTCVDPMDIQRSGMKNCPASSPASASPEPVKLPSLWSDLGRMSWLGAPPLTPLHSSLSDLFDLGRLREVPGQLNCDDDFIHNMDVDYDKLLH